jgi:hypothetical protein
MVAAVYTLLSREQTPRDILPAGWRGLLLAVFLAAYMATVGRS